MKRRQGGAKKRKHGRPRVRLTKDGLWIEQLIDREWKAAFRIKTQYGRPVVGEVRIFPSEVEYLPAGRILESQSEPGEWSGRDEAVPRGGATSRLLRAAVMGQNADALHDYFTAAEKRGRPREKLPQPFRAMAAPAAPVGRRGRPPMSRLDYARLASEYVDGLRRGCRNPVQLVADLRGWTVTRTRSALFRAREFGLLTREGVGQGHSGGRLTPDAEARLLAAQESGTPTTGRKAHSKRRTR